MAKKKETTKKYDGFAIASLVIIVAWIIFLLVMWPGNGKTPYLWRTVLFALIPISGLVSIIFSIISLVRIRKRKSKGKVLAIVSMIGAILLVLADIFFVLIIASLAGGHF